MSDAAGPMVATRGSRRARGRVDAPTIRRAPRPPLGPVRRTIREVGLAMITAGFVIFLFVAYQLWGTALTEEHDQAQLRRTFNAALVHNRSTGAVGPAVVIPGARDLAPSTPIGVAVAHIVIPSIGVDKFVVQGTDENNLMQGPGHYVNTPMPGERGNAAIAGHRTTYGAPFFDLGTLRNGAWVYITDTAGHTFDYRVERKEVVLPTDTAVLDNTPFAELTLTTCNPPYSATSRLVVVARLVGRALPVPKAGAATPSRSRTPNAAAAPSATPPVQPVNLGRGVESAWPPAIAYGALVVALWALTRIAIAVAGRRRRLAALGAFVVGVAVCAVPLWLCFENVVRLLPQNI